MYTVAVLTAASLALIAAIIGPLYMEFENKKNRLRDLEQTKNKIAQTHPRPEKLVSSLEKENLKNSELESKLKNILQKLDECGGVDGAVSALRGMASSNGVELVFIEAKTTPVVKTLKENEPTTDDFAPNTLLASYHKSDVTIRLSSAYRPSLGFIKKLAEALGAFSIKKLTVASDVESNSEKLITDIKLEIYTA